MASTWSSRDSGRPRGEPQHGERAWLRPRILPTALARNRHDRCVRAHRHASGLPGRRQPRTRREARWRWVRIRSPSWHAKLPGGRSSWRPSGRSPRASCSTRPSPGSPAPAFEVPFVSGDTISLETAGDRRLLVFSDPEEVRPCEVSRRRSGALAPEPWRRCPARGHDQSRETRDEPPAGWEEHGIAFPVGCSRARGRSLKPYGLLGPWFGSLIDENGVIVREVAGGPEAVIALPTT